MRIGKWQTNKRESSSFKNTKLPFRKSLGHTSVSVPNTFNADKKKEEFCGLNLELGQWLRKLIYNTRWLRSAIRWLFWWQMRLQWRLKLFPHSRHGEVALQCGFSDAQREMNAGCSFYHTGCTDRASPSWGFSDAGSDPQSGWRPFHTLYSGTASAYCEFLCDERAQNCDWRFPHTHYICRVFFQCEFPGIGWAELWAEVFPHWCCLLAKWLLHCLSTPPLCSSTSPHPGSCLDTFQSDHELFSHMAPLPLDSLSLAPTLWVFNLGHFICNKKRWGKYLLISEPMRGWLFMEWWGA